MWLKIMNDPSPSANTVRLFIDCPSSRDDANIESIVDVFLARIRSSQPELNAFVTITDDRARAEAARIDRLPRSGKSRTLRGMTIAVKDNIDMQGVRTTVGSAVYGDRIAAADAEVIRRLHGAGAVLVGKTVMHEFAFGHSCSNVFYGTCRNPWDLDRIPGGSSGGSATALASDLCVGALGTDTGGSVRVPASLTGVSALRPTFGRVSNRGVFPLARSFDTVGPMARSVADVAAIFAVIQGYDASDARSLREPERSMGRPAAAMSGVRIGVPRKYFFDELDDDVESSINVAIEILRDLGARIIEVDLAGAEEARSSFSRLLRAEAAAIHRGYSSEQLSVIDDEIRRRLAVGTAIPAWEVLDLIDRMYVWKRSVEQLFDTGIDLFVTPTTPITAPRLDEQDASFFGRLGKVTQVLSFARLPGLSIPCAPSSRGLPIGMQISGPPSSESLLFSVGMAFQSQTDWHLRRPEFVTLG
jgi:aspartyl-tRNA(Asn)/glutamyl-tRNA(Gln) amidotransferase subunit A